MCIIQLPSKPQGGDKIKDKSHKTKVEEVERVERVEGFKLKVTLLKKEGKLLIINSITLSSF